MTETPSAPLANPGVWPCLMYRDAPAALAFLVHGLVSDWASYSAWRSAWIP